MPRTPLTTFCVTKTERTKKNLHCGDVRVDKNVSCLSFFYKETKELHISSGAPDIFYNYICEIACP